MRPLRQEQVKEEIEKLNFFRKEREDTIRPIMLRNELKRLMDQHVGSSRDEEGLRVALNRVLGLRNDALPKLGVCQDRIYNADWRMATEVTKAIDFVELIIESALFRKETRGHHCRLDFPDTSSTAEHTLVRKRHGQMAVEYGPVTMMA